jgi:hypothetical protein
MWVGDPDPFPDNLCPEPVSRATPAAQLLDRRRPDGDVQSVAEALTHRVSDSIKRRLRLGDLACIENNDRQIDVAARSHFTANDAAK